jgi:hypothetical protein
MDHCSTTVRTSLYHPQLTLHKIDSSLSSLTTLHNRDSTLLKTQKAVFIIIKTKETKEDHVDRLNQVPFKGEITQILNCSNKILF